MVRVLIWALLLVREHPAAYLARVDPLISSRDRRVLQPLFFFVATLALSFIGSRPIAAGGAGVMDQLPATPAAPAKPQNATGQSQSSTPASGQSSEIPK